MPENMGFPTLPPAQKQPLYEKLLGALLGQGPNSELLTQEQQKALRQQQLMALSASLLQAGGPSPVRTSLGQAIGQGLMSAQQAGQQGTNDALQAMLVKSQIEKSSQQQNRNHVIGNALVDDTGKVVYQGSALDNTFGRVNPGDYTPESLAKFSQSGDWKDLERVWAPPNPTVVQMGGAPNLVQGDRNTGGVSRVTPLSTLPNEITALTQKASAESEAKARGTIIGETEGGIEKKGMAAQNVSDILDVADPLIDLSTGSSAGAAADKIAAMFGKSLDGAQAAAQLQILQAALMFAQPRMEGPQGVLDVQLYEKAAGQIGDPTVPAGTKKAAVKTIRALQSKYKVQAGKVGGAPSGVLTFATEAEAEAAGLKPGTRVIIGGVPGTWQ
jgi:hypothetical protein